ncbi:MAG: hypothetical protein KC486_16280 [Myxococcales bacterium]|nr:hypothetical protein [Myxococcales bacterium]
MILSTLTGLLALTPTGCDMADAGGGDQARAETEVLFSLRDLRDPTTTPDVPHDDLRAANALPLPEIAATATPAPDDPTDVGLGVETASDRDIRGDLAEVQRSLQIYGECATACGEDPDERRTDVQSCMLSCRNVAESNGVTPGSPAHDLVLELDVCLDTCEDADVDRETNRETCRLNCEVVYFTNTATLKAGAAEPSASYPGC